MRKVKAFRQVLTGKQRESSALLVTSRKAQHTKTDSYSSYLVLHFVWTIALLFLNEKANQACITTELCVQSEAFFSRLLNTVESGFETIILSLIQRPVQQFASIEPGKENSFIFCQKRFDRMQKYVCKY